MNAEGKGISIDMNGFMEMVNDHGRLTKENSALNAKVECLENENKALWQLITKLTDKVPS